MKIYLKNEGPYITSTFYNFKPKSIYKIENKKPIPYITSKFINAKNNKIINY